MKELSTISPESLKRTNPTIITGWHIVQTIEEGGGAIEITNLQDIIVKELKSSRNNSKKLRFTYSPYKSLQEMLQSLSGMGQIWINGADVELTPFGRQLASSLPDGIQEALGITA